ncbi:hypothetical protein FVE85_2546 [Porphyridium purpureum]|uniref:Sulfotransferase domain-containing protein n=1 Tax=Porphyridium purpureum TaxID=35688 RepID=A0A5J4YJB2_PORPP|nr:hypothetical protein FVE85_2546 [Porphyridium purpureum]|eukprot:POR4317..scf291_13
MARVTRVCVVVAVISACVIGGACAAEPRRLYGSEVCGKGWNDTDWRVSTAKFDTRLHRAPADSCQEAACYRSGELSRMGCRHAFSTARLSPVLDNTTAVVYNKPRKCGSTTVYGKLREYYARLGFIVGEFLDKDVIGRARSRRGTAVQDVSGRQSPEIMAKSTKFWGWHLEFSEQMREKYLAIRGNKRVFLISSNRPPMTQVVSYFFEVKKHVLDVPSKMTMDNLIHFISHAPGSNNNYVYHFGDSSAYGFNCSSLMESPELKAAKRAEIETFVKRYDWIFDADKLSQDFVSFNQIFELCPFIHPEGNLRERSHLYKMIFSKAQLTGPEVRQAVRDHMCLDTLLYEEMAKRREFLLQLYSGAYRFPGC